MLHLKACVLVISLVGALAYTPRGSFGGKSEPILTEALLREVMDHMGRDFGEQPLFELPSLPNLHSLPNLPNMPSEEQRLALMIRASKDLESEQLDYDSLLDGNPSPSLRDPEYLQHSTLWRHQYMAGGAGEGEQRLRPSGQLPSPHQLKTDAVLPAYCHPPNPCPVGYSEDQGCMSEFENTAAFSRDYQAAQHCMCDSEHMFSCPPQRDPAYPAHPNSLLAKKHHGGNPYLTGERLPIAAKKGFDVNVY